MDVVGHRHDWLKNYLRDLQQRVVVDWFTSSWASATSGVPRGSLIGPLPFIISSTPCQVALPGGSLIAPHADCLLYGSMLSYLDAHKLQQALTNLDPWSLHNNLNFNTLKCKVLSVTPKKNPVRYDNKHGLVDLQRVSEVKDLGVLIKKGKWTWEAQVRMVTARTNKLLGPFRRICSMLTDAKVRRSLYLAAVKSKMNYAIEVCFLSHSTLKQKALRVQRRASRWILKNQARWTFLQRETDSSGSGTLYLWPRGQGFSILF